MAIQCCHIFDTLMSKQSHCPSFQTRYWTNRKIQPLHNKWNVSHFGRQFMTFGFLAQFCSHFFLLLSMDLYLFGLSVDNLISTDGSVLTKSARGWFLLFSQMEHLNIIVYLYLLSFNREGDRRKLDLLSHSKNRQGKMLSFINRTFSRKFNHPPWR